MPCVCTAACTSLQVYPDGAGLPKQNGVQADGRTNSVCWTAKRDESCCTWADVQYTAGLYFASQCVQASHIYMCLRHCYVS
jgi:hypothetical protein